MLPFRFLHVALLRDELYVEFFTFVVFDFEIKLIPPDLPPLNIVAPLFQNTRPVWLLTITKFPSGNVVLRTFLQNHYRAELRQKNVLHFW